jgi:DNA-binding protein HU-beta
MTKQALIDSIYESIESTGVTVTKKAIGDVLTALPEAIIAQLNATRTATLGGIVSINVIDKPARKARNPKTGETLQIPARLGLKIKPIGGLKKAI